MAKPLEQAYTELAEIIPFPPRAQSIATTVQCGCGCGALNLDVHDWIYSEETKGYYNSMMCFALAIDADYEPLQERISVDGYRYRSIAEFMEDYRAYWKGDDPA